MLATVPAGSSSADDDASMDALKRELSMLGVDDDGEGIDINDLFDDKPAHEEL